VAVIEPSGPEDVTKLRKYQNQSIQKEEENGGAVVDSEEIVGPVARDSDAESVQTLVA